MMSDHDTIGDPLDESNTSFLVLVALGATVGLVLGGVSLFFVTVLWRNIEEVPEDPESDPDQND